MIAFQVNFYSFAKKNVHKRAHLSLGPTMGIHNKQCTHMWHPLASQIHSGLFIFGGSYSNDRKIQLDFKKIILFTNWPGFFEKKKSKISGNFIFTMK